MSSERPICIDIDGTLTDFHNQGGNPIKERIARLKELAKSETVVVWSGGGLSYVQRFCAEHGISGVLMMGKPRLVVDDNPNISPSMQIVGPDWLAR